MKASIYNLTSQNPDTKETILFNTLYGSTAVVKPEQLPSVLRILEDSSLALTDEEHTLFASLERGKFVVDESVDELALVSHRKQCGMSDKNRAEIIIMPNLDCNFACPYCYEEHHRSNKMSEDVESSIVKWLDTAIASHKLILLNWFGGEPLLSGDTVLRITRHVRDRCRESAVSLLTNITTNGYSLTDKLIQEFLALDLHSYQITVDGPESIHNKTRILRNGRGSFSRIKTNIIKLAMASDSVKISLRVNYNHNNIHHIPELLYEFPQEVRRQLRVVFEPIFGNSDLSATSNLSPNEISESITEHYELASNLGYDVVLGGLGVGKLVYCYAEREDQYILNFRGEVFKCSVSDFSSNKRVGYIDSTGVLVKEYKQWEAWFGMGLFEKKCNSCIFLPLCMGGCRKERLESKSTGSYCHLIPTNTSHVLKSIAFGNFSALLTREVQNSRNCANKAQSVA